MIINCVAADEGRILEYIGDNYSKCLYLYLNLKKYGIGNPMIDVSIQYEDGKITSVLLNYYSCLHVYSADNSFDAAELGRLIERKGFTMVYCASETAKRIFEQLPVSVLERANVTSGLVGRIENVDKPAHGLAVCAQKQDFDQIVRLIYSDDDIGRSYKFDELAKQLSDRNNEGYARNIVIKKNDVVIAHACTNAELDGIAVVAELLVHPDFRRQGLASEIWRQLCGDLLESGFEVYSFYYTKESLRLHTKIGFEAVCEWSKIVISA